MASQQSNANQGVVKKLTKRFGGNYLFSLTPIIGFLWPGDILLVWRTLKGDRASPEGILMLSLAMISYALNLVIGLIGLIISIGILSTLFRWLTASFFGAWIYMRGSGLAGGE